MELTLRPLSARLDDCVRAGRVPVGRAGLASLALLIGLTAPAVGQGVALGPKVWAVGELERVDSLTRSRGRAIPLARGTHGIVAGTTAAAAVRAGLEALKQGGSAVDAVLADALTDVVLMAHTVVSHAGIMMLVYYDAATKTTHAMNAGWGTVRDETDPRSIPTDRPSGRAVLVPGFMAGAEAAHRRFGRLPWATLFEPAIHFADEGFRLSASTVGQIDAKRDAISRLPASKSVFTKADGTWYQAGDLFRQPALAATLRAVAAQGAGYMYRGAWAQRFVDAVRADGGKLTMKDMESYEARWSKPLRIKFRGYEVLTLPPPNYGGVNLLEALNLVELADLPRVGHYTTSAEAFDRLLGIARVGDIMGTSIISMLLPAPRIGLLDTVAAGLDLDLDARLTKKHAHALWPKLLTPAWRDLDRLAFERPATSASGHSDAVVAADERGNVAALLHTSNNTTWGLLGMLIDGVGINDVGRYQQHVMARTRPGDRLPDPTDPLIVLKDGKPVLASSSIGVGLHEQTLLSLVNVLEYGFDPKTAGDTSQFYRPLGGSSSRAAAGATATTRPASQVVEEGRFAASLLDSLRERGRLFTVLPPSRAMAYLGAWVGLTIDRATGMMSATAPGPLNGWALAF